ncbi:MAG: PKD domain-containing protein [Dehalococcoidia bacterium]
MMTRWGIRRLPVLALLVALLGGSVLLQSMRAPHARAQGVLVTTNGPYAATVGQPVSMSGSLGQVSAGTVQWRWDFGDGTMGSGQAVQKVYNAPGTYVVTLQAQTSQGVIASATTAASITAQERSEEPTLAAFYGALAGACFGLLGLWWVVIQFRFRDEAWLGNPYRRRMAYDISLYFLLPGVMSLGSLLSTGDAEDLWRSVFAIAAALGIVETLTVALVLARAADAPRGLLAGSWIACALYVLIALLAAFPGLVQEVGAQMDPLQVEGLLTSLLLFLGVNFAWLVFTERLAAPPPER